LEFFSSPPRSEWLWDPPNLLSKGYQGLCPWGYSGRVVKLTTHLHLVPRSKNEWSYTSTPQYAFMAWCLVKHTDNFTFIEQLLSLSSPLSLPSHRIQAGAYMRSKPSCTPRKTIPKFSSKLKYGHVSLLGARCQDGQAD
jgi:hypothetical protein